MTHDELYERLLHIAEMTSRISSPSLISGGHRAMIKKGGSDFERSAPFDFSQDDARKFAYRLSARMGKAMKVIKSEEKENLFVCAVMMHQSMSFGMTRTVREFALEVAGILGLTAIASEDRTNLAVMGIGSGSALMECGRNRNLFIARLMQLHEIPHSESQANIIADIERLTSLIPASASAFIISDWIFPPDSSRPAAALADQTSYKDLARCLEILSLRCETGLILLEDIREKLLPNATFRVRSNAASSPLIIRGKGRRSKDMLERLRTERYQWLDGLSVQFGNTDFCTLTTTEDIMEYLPEIMVYLSQRRA